MEDFVSINLWKIAKKRNFVLKLGHILANEISFCNLQSCRVLQLILVTFTAWIQGPYLQTFLILFSRFFYI